ncbi:NAD(P)-dependent oxidoreductase [Streptomyces sp. NPDC002795]|uniref:NAD(P)-dependent oxidoreductase n=1 Tax=Streptomyces sp. NPDC002795 TaxID=3364665 RepID=UPI0036BE2F12
MNILLLGATGMVGSRIAAEALGRGHSVTAVSRSGDVPVAGVTAAAADVSDVQRLTELAGGHDAVASALAPPRDGSDPVKPFLSLNQALVAGVRGAGVARLVVVGGAGSLEVAPGEALMDQPGFPDAYRGEALAHRDVLAYLRTVDDVDWTYISPAAEIGPGERTEEFRVGGDRLMKDADGESRISAEDYALAFVDEIERDAHSRKRMSVAY